jgi:hypothetical protein
MSPVYQTRSHSSALKAHEVLKTATVGIQIQYKRFNIVKVILRSDNSYDFQFRSHRSDLQVCKWQCVFFIKRQLRTATTAHYDLHEILDLVTYDSKPFITQYLSSHNRHARINSSKSVRYYHHVRHHPIQHISDIKNYIWNITSLSNTPSPFQRAHIIKI